MTAQTNASDENLWKRIQAFLRGSHMEKPTGAWTFTITLVILLSLLAIYAALHTLTIVVAENLHTEGTTVDAERMALLLDTAEFETALLTPSAIAEPAVEAVFDSLQKSLNTATDTETVDTLLSDATESLVNLGLAVDSAQPSRDAASARITAFLAEAKKQAEALVASPEDGREIPQRLLEVELELAKTAVLDYMAAPELITRVNTLKETSRGLGYGPDSDVIVTLTRIAEELEKDKPNRDLAAEMLSRIDQTIKGLRTSLFWSHAVLRWVEVISWSLMGILIARLTSAGRFIGINKYKLRWDRWWWAKIIAAPFMAVVIVAFLSYLTIDAQSGDTLGIKISLKDQPIEVVVAVSFIIGLFSNRAYLYLEKMAGELFPTDDDDTRQSDESESIVVEDTGNPIKGRPVEEVQAELEKKGFKVKVEMQASGTGQPGSVLERRPADKVLSKGSEITLVVVQAPSP